MWKPSRTQIVATLLLLLSHSRVWAGGDEPSPAAVRPPRDRALVCFYREPAFQGNWFDYRIADGDQTIGSISAGTFITYLATPGEHTFLARLIAGSTSTFTLQGGHVYYLRADPSYEVLYERPKLSLVTVTEGAAVVAGLNARLRPRLVGERLPLPHLYRGMLSY